MLDRYTATKQYRTPNGKQLVIQHVPNTALHSVKWSSGGEVPEELSGKFTSLHAATLAMDLYLERVWDEYEKVEARAENQRQLQRERKARSKPSEGVADGAASAG